jgi:tetratricopeptide (TPR) repeat protein
MQSGLRCASVLVLFCSVSFSQTAIEQKTPAPSSDASPGAGSPSGMSSANASNAAKTNFILEARELYRQGDFDGAIGKYQSLLQVRPGSPDAYAGMCRVYLKQRKIDLAASTVNDGLALSHDSPRLHVALGEVLFRQGKINEAELEWVKVIQSGYPDARAYMGLARVRNSLAMYKSEKKFIDKAHELDPNDPDVEQAWARSPREKQPKRPCRLVGQVTATETPLVRLLIDAHHLRGFGLAVTLNGHKSNLMLDTGASGITVKRRIADNAGISKLVATKIGGIGDKGSRDAFVGMADRIEIGGLEFQNCPIQVIGSGSVADEDGLIGTDFFDEFLVDIDFPDEKIKLSELPKRPGEENETLAQKEEGEKEAGTPDAPPGNAATADANKQTAPAASMPDLQDRYIAPEMKSFTRVYRFGHHLLVPTKIGDVPPKLFLLDTGSFNNAISPAAAREVTKVHNDDAIVKGVSGSVKKVYSANKAVLQFGNLRQENQDVTAFDMTRISEGDGTEVSGLLGFVMLRFLDIKIDYRDALVNFTYDPKKWNQSNGTW